MPIETTLYPVLAKLAEYFGQKVIDRLTTEHPGSEGLPSLDERVHNALSRHLVKVANWSAQIQFYRMASALDVESKTVPLHFSATPRHFRDVRDTSKMSDEGQLISGSDHLVILGRPGAGKTTTVKRLCQRILTQSPESDLDATQVPILIRLRSFNGSENSRNTLRPLFSELAQELGLQTYFVEREVNTAEPGRPKKIETIKVEMCEGGFSEFVIPQVLNDLCATVFLDGLDEVSPVFRKAIESDISLLIEASTNYRLVITCRTGEYLNPLGYVSVMEVCDLTLIDIDELSRKWLGDRSEEFIAQIQSPSLYELGSRPLFLAQMMNLYQIGGRLPQQPYEIYELVTLLMIREWDRERGFQRTSRYADFGAEKKLRFLALIAFELTYIDKIKEFTGYDLKNVYKRIRKKFELPEEGADQVIKEIESHTGIIVESGYQRYEFSHLTIQEYLAADYIVRSPFPERKIAAFMLQNPSPLAIATALSAEPSAWLAGILMNQKLIEQGERNLIPFLDRLQHENPIFIAGDALGYCVLGLCFRAADIANNHDRDLVESHMDRILKNQIARRSFVDIVVRKYSVALVDVADKFFVASRREKDFLVDDAPYEIEIPERGKIRRAWLESKFFDNELMFNGIHLSKRR